MSSFKSSLSFTYLAKHYLKSFLVILLGLSLIFSVIDYFQHTNDLEGLGSYQVFYVFYKWEEAINILYPLAIIFAVIVTKSVLIKHSNMVALHAFGYDNRQLVKPFLVVSSSIYVIFALLHTTEFSYANEKADHLLKKELNDYQVKDLFFKYNDTFVYVKQLDPVKKRIEDLTIFKAEENRIGYTIKADYAVFDGKGWDAKDAILKTHIYKNNTLEHFTIERKDNIRTLEGYKPKIIESLYEGKALNVVDAYSTWKLFIKQNIDSGKIRATLYDKVITPLFAIAMVLILFFKLPFHARMINFSVYVIVAVGVSLITWGTLFGLARIGYNGVVMPEFSSIVPVAVLIAYALYIYNFDKYLPMPRKGSVKMTGASN